MKILVNGRSLIRRITGVERYVTEILSCLGDRVQVILPTGKRQGLSGHAWEQLYLPGQVDGRSVLWSPANTGPLAVSNQVLTVHDLSPLEHPDWYRSEFAAWYRVFLPLLIRRVRRVITPSQYVRKKILERFHLPADRVVAVPAGVNPDTFYNQGTSERSGRYILFAGSIEPRKNLPTLFTAWKQVEKLHPDVSLLIAGIPGRIFREVALPGDVPRLSFTGDISDRVLAGLYSRADLFVLPSFEEGFGLPVLEAMACGTPVIASTGGALPEVVGDAGLFFSANDPAELAEQVNRCLSDGDLRHELSARGLERARQFSWQSTAEIIWRVLQGVLDEI